MLNKINVSVFEISLLPNYCVKYYDYIVKWCSGMAYNWCVSLDIGIILALRIAMRDKDSNSFLFPPPHSCLSSGADEAVRR